MSSIDAALRRVFLLLLLAGLVWFSPPATMAQPAIAPSDVGALKADLERVKSELEGVKSELRLLREFLQQRLAQPDVPTPPVRTTATVSVANSPSLGRADAPLTLVEFLNRERPRARGPA